jgi:two-component system, cell cycle sensor histidine kinase and response regulator CckA
VQDVTKREQAEAARRASEELFAKAFFVSPNPLCIRRLNDDFRVVEANEAWITLTGYSRDEVVGKGLSENPWVEDADWLRAALERFEQEGRIAELPGELARKTGEHLSVLVWAEPIELDGQPCVLISLQDITRRNEAEEQLLESEERLRLLSEAAWEGIALSDQGVMIDVNNQLAAMFGYEPHELIDRPVSDLVAPSSLEMVRDHIRRGSNEPYEHEAVRKDGSIIMVEARGRTVPYGGRLIRITAIRDITAAAEVRALEAQLQHSQKLEAIGLLAGGVAHDFNNLLTVINGYCERLVSFAGPDSPIRGDLDLIQEAGQRAAALTSQLLAFGRRQIMQPRVVDLNSVVVDMDKMLRRVLGETIVTREALDPSLGTTHADPGQLGQVIMNLAINARDAMPTGGTLTIETSNVDVFPNEPSPFRLPPGEYVSMIVRDTGHGMDEERLSHIFEPFFTTKEAGKGSGLGLPTVYGIVKQSGGEIVVESTPDAGTTVRVFLPRVHDAPDPMPAAPASPVATPGSETLLLVEDEELVRDLVREFLEEAGYRVIEAQDAHEALRIANAGGTPAIDLVVTDVVLPAMNGSDLVKELQRAVPKLKALYMSGYPGDAAFRPGASGMGAAFLAKPFTRDALTQKVREVLSTS